MNQIESKYSVQQQELEQVAKGFPLLNELNGKYILITGATGLLGTQIVKTLLCFNRINHSEIHVIACGRSQEKINEVYGELCNLAYFHSLIADVRTQISVNMPVDYIIHNASVTSSEAFVQFPVDTIKTAVDGTMNLLELAREKEVSAFLYTSSLEVYGVPPKMSVSENDYGFIDILNIRSSYSEGKRMAECICMAYQSQYGVPVKIARLTQTIGSGIDYKDNRVFAQFAKCVIEKKDIVLNTAARTVRSYCDICDAARAIITVLLNGSVGEAYNVANKETTISIADMAQMVCDCNPNSKIKVVFDAPKDVAKRGYNPEMKISLDTTKLEALGWSATIGLEEMYQKLITGLHEKREEL